MRAAVLRGVDLPFEIEEITLGELRADEVLVRIVASGMCHTDLILRNPARADEFSPIVAGHEGAGVVEAVGSGVTRVAPGDHVLLSFDSCGWCSACLTGAPAYCAEFTARNMYGVRGDGSTPAADAAGEPVRTRWFGQSSFAEHAIATERNLVVVAPDVPLELMGPLGCGLQTGAGSVFNEMKLGAGQSIAVFGAGAVGLAAVMAAKIAGAGEIVAVDMHPARLELARELGATRVIPGGSDDVLARIVGDSDGVDFAFDTTAVTGVITTAISALRHGGKAVLVGAGAGRIDISPVQLIGRSVTFALEGGAVPQVLLPQLIQHWREGRFPIEKLVRTYPLDDINRAEADSLSGATIKPVLVMS